MMKNLTIGEVSKKTGIPSSTIRYYEEKKLVKSCGRRGLTRIFSSSVIEKLSFITLAQFADFSLNEIASMFTINGRVKINREQLLLRAQEIENQIKKLKLMQKGLEHVANCPEADQFECANFRKLLARSNKIQLEKRGAK